jgi:hypothetical protein
MGWPFGTASKQPAVFVFAEVDELRRRTFACGTYRAFQGLSGPPRTAIEFIISSDDATEHSGS